MSTESNFDPRLFKARDLKESKQYAEALTICSDLLDEDFNNAQALFIYGGICVDNNRKGLAYNIFARVCKLVPDSAEAWVMFGRAQEDTPDGWDKSEWCFKKAIELNPEIYSAYTNLGSLMVSMGQPKKAFPYLKKALEITPNGAVAKSCKAFAHLMLGQWKQGWALYHHMMGHRSRPVHEDGLPEWQGEKGEGITVIVDGEQGIGDELIYSSVLPDMTKDVQVVYNCMPKLETLMRRSFPNVYVTGERFADVTHYERNIHGVKFNKPTHKISQAGTCMFYRNKDSDFPGTPYLKADPDKQKAVRALLDSLGPNPKIGIGWTGGTKTSRMEYRRYHLEDFTEMLQIPDIDWISLQYKTGFAEEINEYTEKTGIKIHHYDWITEIRDYDFTAALVSELDLVIAVPTSATQLAGALGKEAWVLVPEVTGWLFNRKNYVWANSLRLFHHWKIGEVAKALKEKLGAIKEQKAA